MNDEMGQVPSDYTIVAWADIEFECGSYREGFVAIFRRYEGRLTDEKDERGVVRVTLSSFARHAGIPERTFRDWVNSAVRAVSPEEQAKKDLARARRLAPSILLQVTKENPELAKMILEDEDIQQMVAHLIEPEAHRMAREEIDEEYGIRAAMFAFARAIGEVSEIGAFRIIQAAQPKHLESWDALLPEGEQFIASYYAARRGRQVKVVR